MLKPIDSITMKRSLIDSSSVPVVANLSHTGVSKAKEYGISGDKPPFFSRRCDPTSRGRRAIGPEYCSSNAVYCGDSNKQRATYYRDEVYDFLDSGLYPFRIANCANRTSKQVSKCFADFSRQARRVYMVTKERDGNGRRTLFKRVMGRKDGAKLNRGRDLNGGPRVVPPLEDVADIIADVRCHVVHSEVCNAITSHVFLCDVQN